MMRFLGPASTVVMLLLGAITVISGLWRDDLGVLVIGAGLLGSPAVLSQGAQSAKKGEPSEEQ